LALAEPARRPHRGALADHGRGAAGALADLALAGCCGCGVGVRPRRRARAVPLAVGVGVFGGALAAGQGEPEHALDDLRVLAAQRPTGAWQLVALAGPRTCGASSA
jgi:hypothetical protein